MYPVYSYSGSTVILIAVRYYTVSGNHFLRLATHAHLTGASATQGKQIVHLLQALVR